MSDFSITDVLQTLTGVVGTGFTIFLTWRLVSNDNARSMREADAFKERQEKQKEADKKEMLGLIEESFYREILKAKPQTERVDLASMMLEKAGKNPDAHYAIMKGCQRALNTTMGHFAATEFDHIMDQLDAKEPGKWPFEHERKVRRGD